jgi:hypothetical protein
MERIVSWFLFAGLAMRWIIRKIKDGNLPKRGGNSNGSSIVFLLDFFGFVFDWTFNRCECGRRATEPIPARMVLYLADLFPTDGNPLSVSSPY